MVNGLHLYSAFIQSALQFMPLIHTHIHTHQRRLAAMQGTNQLVRSNWGLGILLRDTSTHPGWDRTGNPPTARRPLLPPEPHHPRNNKDLHGRDGRKKSFLWPQYKMKHLKYAKDNMKLFGKMCFGLTKPTLNSLATTNEGIFLERKKGEAFVEKLNLPTVDPLCFGGCGAAGGTGNIGRKNGFHQCSMVSPGEDKERLDIPSRQ